MNSSPAINLLKWSIVNEIIYFFETISHYGRFDTERSFWIAIVINLNVMRFHRFFHCFHDRVKSTSRFGPPGHFVNQQFPKCQSARTRLKKPPAISERYHLLIGEAFFILWWSIIRFSICCWASLKLDYLLCCLKCLETLI